jgi:hypothetical protein
MKRSGPSDDGMPPARRAASSRDAYEIAARLGESDLPVVQQIWRILAYCGAEVTWGLVAAAEAIDADGGMVVPDGTRRRTRGGVFFALVKQQLPPDVRAALLPTARERNAARAAAGTQAALPQQLRTPPVPLRAPDAWAVREVAIASAHRRPGALRMLTAILYGRPGEIVEHPSHVAFTLLPRLRPEADRAFQELKRLPHPDPMPSLPYLVYALPKHWRRVAPFLEDPEDELIIEVAYLTWDDQTRHLVVWAKRLATRKQREERARTRRSGGPGGPPAG